MSIGNEINCCSEDLGIEKGMSYRELRDVILNRLLEYDKHINRPRDVENAVLNSIQSIFVGKKDLNRALILIAFGLYGVDYKETTYGDFFKYDESFKKLEAGEYDDQLTEEDKLLIEEDMEEVRRRAGKFKVKPRSYKKGSYNYLGVVDGYSYRDYVDGTIDSLNRYLKREKIPWKAIVLYLDENYIVEENGVEMAFCEIANMLFEMEVGEVDKAVAVPACTALNELESGEYDFLLTQEDIEELHKDGEKIKRYCKDHNILNPEEFGLKLN